MAFNNTSISPPRPSKPHICVREGWWRVSPLRVALREAWHVGAIEVNVCFNKAHLFINRLNRREKET